MLHEDHFDPFDQFTRAVTQISDARIRGKHCVPYTHQHIGIRPNVINIACSANTGEPINEDESANTVGYEAIRNQVCRSLNFRVRRVRILSSIAEDCQRTPQTMPMRQNPSQSLRLAFGYGGTNLSECNILMINPNVANWRCIERSARDATAGLILERGNHIRCARGRSTEPSATSSHLLCQQGLFHRCPQQACHVDWW